MMRATITSSRMMTTTAIATAAATHSKHHCDQLVIILALGRQGYPTEVGNNNNLRLLESRHTAQPTHRHNQQAATQDSTSTSTGTQARYNNRV